MKTLFGKGKLNTVITNINILIIFRSFPSNFYSTKILEGPIIKLTNEIIRNNVLNFVFLDL